MACMRRMSSRCSTWPKPCRIVTSNEGHETTDLNDVTSVDAASQSDLDQNHAERGPPHDGLLQIDADWARGLYLARREHSVGFCTP